MYVDEIIIVMCTLNRMPGSGSVTWFSNEITGHASIAVNVQPRFITKNTRNMTLERSPSNGSNPSADHVMTPDIIKQAEGVKTIEAFY